MKLKSPPEILDAMIELSVTKSRQGVVKLLILGIAAGAFIALGAEGSMMASFNLIASSETFGLGRALMGLLFATGLMLVIMAGGELFTGNTMIITGVLEKKVSTGHMLKNWVLVYFSNMLGAVLIAVMMYYSGLFDSGEGLLGAVTLKTAVSKANLGFAAALVMGILCNWLVCLAVWLSMAAQTVAGKVLGILFPIWLFVTSGFEHSVANMYYIPAGMLAKNNEAYVSLSGIGQDALANLNLSGFFITNLIPVTIGNIIGGSLCVGTLYWLAYKKAK